MMATRLLILEDHATTVEALRAWFSLRGFDVTAVRTARDARRSLRRSTPDALLTDWSLGPCGSTSASVIREIRRRSRRIPVIVFTAEARDEVMANLPPDAQPVRVLEKPASARRIERVVEDSLARVGIRSHR